MRRSTGASGILWLSSSQKRGRNINEGKWKWKIPRLGFELMLIYRCNMREESKVKGDYVIDPKQFYAPTPETVEPQTTLLDLPQEDLDEVSGSEFSSDLCQRSHHSPRYIHWCKTILYLHLYFSCADTDQSLDKFVAFSRPLLNSQSSS